MSTLRVDQITNENGTGAVEFSQGVSIPENKTITGNISVTGIVTATTFVGSGIGLTATNSVPNSKAFALNFIT